MKRYSLNVAIILATFFIGYLSAAINRSPVKGSSSTEILLQNPSKPVTSIQQSKPCEASSLYHDEGIITWDSREKGMMLEARLETLIQTPDDLWDTKKYSYWSRLTIKNLQTDKVIYEKKFESFFVSMYTRDLNNDSHVELILTMTPGAVCEELFIFAITPKRAKLILEKPHRLLGDAEFVNGEGKLIDVLITDAELGTGPYYTTRYVWRGKKYQPIATVPVEEFSKDRQSLYRRKQGYSGRK